MAGGKRSSAAMLTAAVAMVTVPIFLVLLHADPGDSGLQRNLEDEVAELERRIRAAEAYNSESRSVLESLRKDLEHPHDQEISGKDISEFSDLQMHLHHLESTPFPVVRLSRGRSKVSVVIGVPTVRRQVQSYLASTLQNLLENMSPAERNASLIVVFFGETDEDYLKAQTSELESIFPEYIKTGVLEAISPPSWYYPDLATLALTLGDKLERIKWRSKQNLDYAFLMTYARSKGTYYLQVEDDVLSKPGFLSVVQEFVAKQNTANPGWVMLDYCQLGFIGKLFRTVDLSKLVTFLALFYNDKPVDWLLDNFIQTKVCRFDKDSHDCKRRKDKVWVNYRPSLFQHVGTHSSLRGKVQQLKDRQFGSAVTLYSPHRDNPPASNLTTTLRHYKTYSLARAYRGDGFFWGLFPRLGDAVTIVFARPTPISRILIRSGNPEHPSDRLGNVTIEGAEAGGVWTGPLARARGGLLEASLRSGQGPLTAVRLNFLEDHDHWVIISEIHIVRRGALR